MLNKLIFSFALMFAGTASAAPDLSFHQSVESVQQIKEYNEIWVKWGVL